MESSFSIAEINHEIPRKDIKTVFTLKQSFFGCWDESKITQPTSTKAFCTLEKVLHYRMKSVFWSFLIKFCNFSISEKTLIVSQKTWQSNREKHFKEKLAFVRTSSKNLPQLSILKKLKVFNRKNHFSPKNKIFMLWGISLYQMRSTAIVQNFGKQKTSRLKMWTNIV